MSDAPTFQVTLHHLAPDARQVGVAFPDHELVEIDQKKLRALIRALAAHADRDLGAAAPELRITAAHGRFVVQIAAGKLRINSWTMRVGGTDLSPDQIFSLITGAEAVADAAGLELGPGRKRSRLGVILLMAAVIVGTNATTAWMLLRTPPNPLLPEFTALATEPGARLLASVAGEYQTGTGPGSRALVIAGSGRARWRTFGPDATVLEEAELPLQPVSTHGQSALLADGRALIELRDAASVTFYNETYRRKAP